MRTTLILPAATLLQRELTRFFRQPNRVIGALATPLVFWVLIGSGMASSFRPASMPPGMTSMEYLFPGALTLIILFTSIFSTISIIEDRREGFLQSVLVAPIFNAAVALGKILGGAAVALIQAFLFLLLAPLVGIHWTAASLAMIGLVVFLMAFALTGLGFVIAWRMDSVQGFHAIMNLFLMPMWMLSGALFPGAGAPAWLEWIMRFNPLTYGVTALRRTLYWPHSPFEWELPSLAYALSVTVLFGLFFFAFSLWMVGKKRTAHG